MRFSSHWSFDLQAFLYLFVVTSSLWIVVYLLLPRALRENAGIPSVSWAGAASWSLQIALVWSLVLACGLALSRRVGIEPLALTSPQREAPLVSGTAVLVGRGLLWGLVIGILFDVLHRVLFSEHRCEWNAEITFRSWRSFVSSAIGAAQGEEAVFRMLLFPLLAWLIGLVWHNADGFPASGAMWTGLLLATLLSASSHLPILEDFGGYTTRNIMRGLLLFGLPVFLLGLAYWKGGLETAMIAHGSGLLIGWIIVSTEAATTRA